MSDAKKCDRCGEFYEQITTRKYQLRANVNQSSTTPSTDYQTRDLCSECYDGLTEWFEEHTE
jgi:hypothetical protein